MSAAADASGWLDRVDALLQAAHDAGLPSAPAARSIGPLPPAHRELFRAWVDDLRRAVGGADAWWQAMLATQRSRGAAPAAAEREVRRLHPLGRVSDRGVIAAVRRHWLACDALNRSLAPPDLPIAPEDFVLARLVEPHPELARFLSDLPYWPMGMDADGHWC